MFDNCKMVIDNNTNTDNMYIYIYIYIERERYPSNTNDNSSSNNSSNSININIHVDTNDNNSPRMEQLYGEGETTFEHQLAFFAEATLLLSLLLSNTINVIPSIR